MRHLTNMHLLRLTKPIRQVESSQAFDFEAAPLVRRYLHLADRLLGLKQAIEIDRRKKASSTCPDDSLGQSGIADVPGCVHFIHRSAAVEIRINESPSGHLPFLWLRFAQIEATWI